jgi:hypothetical protein
MLTIVDINSIYFFHNIYGDATELLATKPDDAIAVPFGWDPETEENRNNILSQLSTSVSGLPSVLYYQPASTIVENQSTIVVPAYWAEFNFYDKEKPWTWSQYYSSK